MVDKIVNKICIELDVEFLFKLPKSVQDYVFEHARKINTPLANFFTYFIPLVHQQNYDNYKTISFKLNPSGKKHTTLKKLKLENELMTSKRNIDTFHNFDKNKLKFYTDYTKYLDQFKHYIQTEIRNNNQPRNFTNAWIKCWEMIKYYRLIPEYHSDKFTVFCNAEFPGAFIFAINHFIKTETKNKNYEWFANSLWPDSGKDKGGDILGDYFGLYKKYKDSGRWLMNETASGDVTSKQMIDIIREKLGGKVDLYTSDIGIELNINEMTEEETIEAPLNLGQIVCALNTLKNDGHMVCKTFLFFKPFTMSLLYVLTSVFKELYICKPMSSRPGNSEIYIVGKYYTENKDVTIRLENILYSWNKKQITIPIEPIPDEFYLQLVYDLYYIYGRQKHFLDTNMYLVKSEYTNKRGSLPDIKEIFKRHPTDHSKQEIQFRSNIVTAWKKQYPIKKLLSDDRL